MQRRMAFALATLLALVATIAGCAGTPATADPYDLVLKSRDATWEQVQVNVGVSTQGGETPITINPADLKFAADTKAGKVVIHLALPVKLFGANASSLRAIGVTGESLDVDVLFDGDALYARSPIATSLITLLSLQTGGEVPSGDLTGWIKLGTKADFAGLLGETGSTPPSAAPMASFANAAELKAKLEAAGITLTYVGSEQHAGVDANHLTAVIDMTKLATSDVFSGAVPSQLESFKTMAEASTVTADVWLDKGNSRVVGLDIHGVSKTNSAEKFDITVTFRTPEAGTSFDSPSSSVDFPIAPLIGQLMGSFLGGGLTQ